MYKSHPERKTSQLPSWLWVNSASLPAFYKLVWEKVRGDQTRGVQDEVLVDTDKVFPLLLTSRLSTDTLGRIWNLANKKYAGQLTEQELYVVLALVAVAQSSCVFNSLDILHSLPYPPVPYLNLEQIPRLRPHVNANSTMEYQPFAMESTSDVSNFYNTPILKQYTSELKSMTKTFSSDINPVSMVHQPQPDVNFMSGLQSDLTDEFTEFQSALPSPSRQHPLTTTTIPNIQIWDGKQGSAIGSRLANHNLGVKQTFDKPKKTPSIDAKAASHNNLPAPAKFRSPGNTASQSRDKERALTECYSELFPKCTLKNQSKTVILRDTAIRSYSAPKDRALQSKESRTNIAPENVEAISAEERVYLERTTNVPKVISKKEANAEQRDLMNLQPVEDKYRALRELVQETTSLKSEKNIEGNRNDVNNVNDDNVNADEFGEFVSAQVSAEVGQLPEVAAREKHPEILTACELESRPINTDSNLLTDLQLTFGISNAFENLKLNDNSVEHSDVARLDSIADAMEGKSLPKEDAISVNSIESNNGAPGMLTRSGSVPSLDLKSFLPLASEEDQTTDNAHQTMYWEWKQYMESCVLLLQVAANIFSSITTEIVLREVLNSAQGYYFLCHLAEVAAVCRRVNFSYKEMDICIMGCDELLMDIDRIWAEMEPFYVNIPIVTELPAWPTHQSDSAYCSLCLTVITNRRIVHNDNNYHATCANLWLRCVSNHLPVMRYPTPHSQTVMCPNSSHI